MVYMKSAKVKKNIAVEEDVWEQFLNWADRTETPLGSGVQVALWILIHVDANTRVSPSGGIPWPPSAWYGLLRPAPYVPDGG